MRFSDIYRKSYGAVRCCDIYPTVRFGAVCRNQKYYGAFFRNQEFHGAVRCGFHKSDILRCGSARFPVERFFLRCGSTPRRKNRTTPLFLDGAPYEYSVQNRGFVRFSRFFSGHQRNRCFSTISLRCTVLLIKKRTNPRVRTVFCRLFLLMGKVISNNRS